MNTSYRFSVNIIFSYQIFGVRFDARDDMWRFVGRLHISIVYILRIIILSFTRQVNCTHYTGELETQLRDRLTKFDLI